MWSCTKLPARRRLPSIYTAAVQSVRVCGDRSRAQISCAAQDRYPALKRRVAHTWKELMEGVDGSHVDEAAPWITVADIVAADEVIRRGRIVRVGRVLVEN